MSERVARNKGVVADDHKSRLARPAAKLEPLISENDEPISIFVASIKTAKQKDM